MNRGRRKRLVVIAVLVVLILLLGGLYWNYRATKRITLDFDLTGSRAASLAPPEYLYSFSGPDSGKMQRPLGVLVDGNRVFVTDGRQRRVGVYTLEGRLVRSFGDGKLVIPLYIAKHPKTGEYWVTDRRLRAICIFDAAGTFKREFDPKLPAEQLPKFETGGVQWAPIALDFADDGTLYVTEIVGHRLLVFGPDGAFKRSIGTGGQVSKAGDDPQLFMFPNSVKVHGDEVWVADSNNRRLKVYNLAGDYLRLVEMEGLPRGMDFLPRLSGEAKDAPANFLVADTLSHDCTIMNVTGAKLASFGEHGVLEGQFSYPNDVSVAKNAYMFIADTSNARVQVWGWPAEAQPIPTPRTAWEWAACCLPFLPILLLPFFRRRRFFATQDFVETMLFAEMAHTMPDRRRRWIVEPYVYEVLRDRREDDVKMSELLAETDHSESDARSLRERLELDEPTSITMAIAQRSHVFCTQDPELRRIAKVLDIDVVDRDEFIERFTRKGAPTDERRS
ncbi:MAG: hypothetical protein FDZ70_04835 [Actinobacteria bacterium]|nr:MAG: hypothetical protein FDZ70_04835 [Actinomycetota bacterium]